MRNNQRRTGHSDPSPSSPAPSQANLAYVVPTEFVELPSRGLFYDHDHPLHNQETVEIKFMTAKEEDILSSAPLIKKGLVIDRLLANILVPDIDPKSLLAGDRSAIMIATRISGYGREYKVNLTCPVCKTQGELDFNLRMAAIVGNCFDHDYLNNNNIKFNEEAKTFDLELPVSKVNVSIKPVDGYRETPFQDAEAEESIVTSLLSRIMVAVEGDPTQVSNFVNVIPAGDSKYIRTMYSALIPNIELKDTFGCNHCYHTEETEVPLTAEFFWPR